MPAHAYPYLVVVHLMAAVAFGGTVFFEVLVLGRVRRRVPHRAMVVLEEAIGRRTRRLMPWVVLALFASGAALAGHHHAVLLRPAHGSFGLLLCLKIVAALSVFGHVLFVMFRQRGGRLTAQASRRIHLSVFVHVVAIVLLAKAMFFVHW